MITLFQKKIREFYDE